MLKVKFKLLHNGGNPYVVLGILPLQNRKFHFHIPQNRLNFALEIKSENRLHLSIEQALCIRFALSLHRESEHRSLNIERKLNNLKMKIMKKFNKVIAIMMMMSITFAMPAMAGSKHHNNGKNDKVVVVNDHKSESHFDKVDKALSHHDAHKPHAYRPDVKTCTIKVSHRDSHHKVVAKVENMKGVMDTNWNPRTRELTVRYDANKTSARNIKHFVA